MESVLRATDTLALLPTGGGKSLCYQVPAIALKGFCLVISPLVALMEDQVSRLQSLGIRAAALHAGMSWAAVKRVLEEAVAGNYKLLYVSPERLQSQLFRDYLPALPLNLIAVDEAHCISQWGHDFRPEYLQIGSVRQVHAGVPLLALTASATPQVEEDIIRQLRLSRPALFRQSFDRSNIYYEVRYSEDKERHLLEALKAIDGSAIVYCRSRRNTETVSRLLQQHGLSALPYHAGMARARREETQRSWMQQETRIMTATTAFGMGIDKADVRLVVHYDAPEQLEAYYQEAGRAGRDGNPARALTLYNRTDLTRLRDSIALQFPPADYLRQVYQAVNEYLQVPISAEPHQYFPFELSDFCRKFRLKALPATYALRLLAREGLWTLSDAVFQPATVRFTADRHAVDHFNARYPEPGAVAIALLRLYNGIYHYPVAVRPFAVARKLRLPKAHVEQALQLLHQAGIISYQPATDGPQLFYHHYRVDSRQLHIDTGRIARLKEQLQARIGAMILFLEEEEQCRSRILLAYFGEAVTADCGHCDNCAGRQWRKSPAEPEVRRQIADLLSKAGIITVQELTSQFPAADRGSLYTVIRRMVDDGLLHWQEDNTISLKKHP